MATIKEIKDILTKIDKLDDPRLLAWQDDPRKGVSKLVENRIKSIEKVYKLKENHKKRQEYECNLRSRGIQYIAGIDEVGRGPLAGPVVAAAVILPANVDCLLGINDSKQMNASQRRHFESEIKEIAVAYGFGVIDNTTIDQVNIYQASKLAMLQAVAQLDVAPQHLLIDAMTLHSSIPQTSIVKGDQKSVSIAAAAILAKEYRDRLMEAYGQQYPEYDFASNVGYGTPHHLQAIKVFGPCPIHRHSFEPIKSLFK